MTDALEKQSLTNQVLGYIRDPAVALWRKASGLLAVVYVVSPVDVLPDIVPIIGWLDDVGVAGAIAWFLIRDIRKHSRRQRMTGQPIPEPPLPPDKARK